LAQFGSVLDELHYVVTAATAEDLDNQIIDVPL
jgi:hypothetical protein